MKSFLNTVVVTGLVASLGWVSHSSAQENALAQESSAQELLYLMSQATEQLDYELSYIVVQKNSIEALRYRHSLVKGASFGQVLYLAGPYREVIRRGDETSYFEPGIEPFTIITDKMVAPLPSIMHADVKHLSTLYDFVSLGRAREAGLACDVVRVSPKDGQRYSYVLWIDQKSKLLVRADLLDRDGEPIEQYRALSLIVSPQISDIMGSIADIKLPLVVQFPKKEAANINWTVTDLPVGFKRIFSHRHRLLVTDRPVESLLFSDGLFSFSVYLAQADTLSVREQLVRKGRQTLHSLVKGNAEITVVGDIPPATAKKVAESVRFNKKKALPVLDETSS